jgi:DNA-binding PadR family transcriptional regulator
VYSLTAKGRERLQEWLVVPAVPEDSEERAVAEAVFGSHAPLNAEPGEVEAFVARQEGALKVYRNRAGTEAAWEPVIRNYCSG